MSLLLAKPNGGVVNQRSVVDTAFNAARSGVTLSGNEVTDIVRALAREGDGRSSPPFGSSAPLRDDFNRADAGTLGANWTNQINDYTSGSGLSIESNRAKGAAAATNEAYWNVEQFGPDVDVHWSAAVEFDTLWGQLFCRLTNIGNGTTDGYMLYYIYNAGTAVDRIDLVRFDNGVATQIGASAYVELEPGDRVGLRAIGSRISAWHKPVGGQWTEVTSVRDTTYSAAGYVGAALRAGNTIRADDFYAGTVTPVSDFHPDGSVGLYGSATNYLPNGGAESNLTSWLDTGAETTFTRETTGGKFGSCFVRTVVDVASVAEINKGIIQRTAATFSGSAGQTYMGSLWIRAATPADIGKTVYPQLLTLLAGLYKDNSQNLGTSGPAAVLSADWQRYTPVVTATQAFDQLSLEVRTQNAVNTGIDVSFDVDGFQIEAGGIATPYIETDGATVARSGPRIQMPAAVLDETQGWMAYRIRPSLASSSLLSGNHNCIFHWGDASFTERLVAYLNYGASPQAVFARQSSVGGESAVSVAASWVAGQEITVVVAWDATNIYVSLNGGNFASLSNTALPVIDATLADLGTLAGEATRTFAGDFLWVAAGSGTLTNADALTIHGYGSSDPINKHFPGEATFRWSAAELVDTARQVKTLVRAITDTGTTISESIAVASGKLRTITDTGASISDSIVGGKSFVRPISDTAMGTSPAQVVLTGEELTDLDRALAYEGDGRQLEATLGIWRSSTNYILNGGLETNTTGWATSAAGSSTFARTTETAKFGVGSLKVTSLIAAADWGCVYRANCNPADASVWTASAWVKGSADTIGDSVTLAARQSGGVAGPANGEVVYFTLTGDWQRIDSTVTVNQTDRTHIDLFVIDRNGSSLIGDSFYVDGAQIEIGANATPYIHTDGSTASRAAAGARVPRDVTKGNAQQGWFACRIRVGKGPQVADLMMLRNREAFEYLWCYQNQFGFSIQQYDGTNYGGLGFTAAGAPVIDQIYTAIFAWDGTNWKVSVDGAAFVTAARGSSYVDCDLIDNAASPQYIGIGAGVVDAGYPVLDNGLQLDGEFFWAMTGTGLLSDGDAATIHAIGNADPTDKYVPGTPTWIWPANPIMDALAGGKSLGRAITDTGATVTESLQRSNVHRRLTDTGATVTDSLVRRASRVLTDTGATVTDALASRRSRVLTDTGMSISESIAAVRKRVLVIADTGMSISESIAAARNRVRAIADTGVTNSESIAISRKRAVTTTDTGMTLTESITNRISRVLSDTGATIADSVVKTGSSYGITDTGASITESLVRRATRQLSDVAASITETLVSLRQRRLTDTGATVTDVLQALRARQAVDTAVVLTESVARTQQLQRAIADTGTTITDSIVRRAARLLVDTGVTSSDSIAPSRVWARTVSDTGATVTDALALRPSRALSDTGSSINESIGRMILVLRAIADTGATIADSLYPTGYFYPIADVTTGGWTPNTGTDLYAVIDEWPPSNSDFIQSSLSPLTPDISEVRLQGSGDPGVDFGHGLEVVYAKDLPGGDRIDLTVTVLLADASTVVATRAYPDIEAELQDIIQFTEVEAATITPSDRLTGLVVRFEAVKV